MSTIVYSDGILAADTGMTSNCTRTGHTSKIGPWKGAPPGGCGAAGAAGWTRRFRDWARDDGRLETCPLPPDSDRAGGTGLLVAREGAEVKLFIVDPTGWFPVRAPYLAIGSGRDLALGALAVCATAETAVRIALCYDDGTYGDVETLAL